MVVDFGDLKSVMMTRIHDVLDHGFIVYDLDEVMKQALNIPFEFGYESEQTWRVIQLPYVPTAENLALWCFTQLNDVLDLDRFHLDEVTVWETPTSSATYNPHWENL
jgi:6-pyruvoyltetrahydropterin/6-carboxytetrahydropterin synthase